MKTLLAAGFVSAAILAYLIFLPAPVRHYAPLVTEQACGVTGDWEKAGRPPFYVLPHAEGLELTLPERVKKLVRRLDDLEPGGAFGEVQLGYTATLLPFSYYTKEGDRWRLDLSLFRRELESAAAINRPFVAYLLADHYQQYDLPFMAEMRKNPRNLMQYRGGTHPDETFMGFRLSAFTLSSNEDIPVVQAHYDAMRGIAAELKRFDEAHPGLLVGVELNGETHYLFPNFFTGTGEYEKPELTDYSPDALVEFGSFLKAKGDLENVEDILKIDLQHGESGLLPVSGWVTGPVERVEILIDGKRVATALHPISRMDVYELPAKKTDTPNIGFGQTVDVKDLPAGRHLLQVIAVSGEHRLEIGRRSVDSGKVNGSPPTPPGADVPKLTKGFAGSLDQPSNEYPVRYRLIAREFLEFRKAQIAARIMKTAAVFRNAGFDERQIFSYQFAPWMVGGWNPMLFGIGQDFFQLPGMLPGINTYNGSLMNPEAFTRVDRRRGYAIPETHPQMPGGEAAVRRSLRWHYCHGAIYLGPYFLKLRPTGPLSQHDKFRIEPENPDWGSADYYRALRDFVRH